MGRIPYGRFGHAMAKLEDINGDSFEGLINQVLISFICMYVRTYEQAYLNKNDILGY